MYKTGLVLPFHLNFLRNISIKRKITHTRGIRLTTRDWQTVTHSSKVYLTPREELTLLNCFFLSWENEYAYGIIFWWEWMVSWMDFRTSYYFFTCNIEEAEALCLQTYRLWWENFCWTETIFSVLQILMPVKSHQQ